MTNSTLYMNTVFWLAEKRSIFYQFLVFSALPPSQGTVLGKYHTRGKIPSLISLWRRWCNSELFRFLLSTNAKQSKEKWQTTVSAVMFEIVEMYTFQIYLHYFFTCSLLCIVAKQWFIIFSIVPEIHFFEKIFTVFLDWWKSWRSNERGCLKFWTCLHATVLLAVKYSPELSKYIL